MILKRKSIFLLVSQILVVLFQMGCNSPKEDTKIMGDGEYDVIFNDRFSPPYEDFVLKIVGNTYQKKLKSGEIIKGQLDRISRKMYAFTDHKPENGMRDSTELSKQLRGLGKPIVELTADLSNDTIMFRTTHQANLLITINEGTIIKKIESD